MGTITSTKLLIFESHTLVVAQHQIGSWSKGRRQLSLRSAIR